MPRCLRRFLTLGIVGLQLSMAAAARADDWDDLYQQFDSLRQAGNAKEAESIGRQMLALANRENNQVRVAAALGFLGLVVQDQARYAEAESLCNRSLELWVKAKGSENDIVAEVINNLANIYVNEGRYGDAEPLLQKSLAMRERVLGPEHAAVAGNLNDLGVLLYHQGRYEKSIPYFQRALAIDKRAVGADDPQEAMVMDNLATVYNDQGRHAEAEPLYKRGLAIRESSLGPDHPLVAGSLNNLAELYREQGRYAEAEPLYKRSLAIREKQLGADHPDVAASLTNLALLNEHQAKYAQAEPLYQRALAIQEKQLGPDHPALAVTVNDLATLYDQQGKPGQAEPLYQRALAIREKQLGPDHPDVAAALNNLAGLYVDQAKYAEAQPLLDRAITILETSRAVPDFLFKAYDYRADLDWRTNRRELAVADLGKALAIAEQMRTNVAGAESERATFFGFFSGAFERMVDWQNQLGHLDEALSMAERSRARTLIDQMNVQGTDLLAGLPVNQATGLKQHESAAQAKVAALEKQLEVLPRRNDFTDAQKKTAEASLVNQLKAAREEQIDSYRDIRNASPACRLMAGKDFKPVPLEVLQAWTKDQSGLLLQYFLGDKAGYLLVISGDETPQLLKLEITKQQAAELSIDDKDAKDSAPASGTLPLTAQRAKAALTLDGQDLPLKLSQAEKSKALVERLAALWTLLIPPAQREALIKGKYKRLILVPDGALVNLPFEALVLETAENPVYFLDKGPPIIVGPSSTLLYNLSQREAAHNKRDNKPVLTVGDPKYPAPAKSGGASRGTMAVLDQSKPRARYGSRGSLERLLNSGIEVGWVFDAFSKNGLGSSKLLQADATEARFRDAAAGREVLHLACHGLVDGEHGNFFGALALTPGPKADSNPADDGFLTLPEIYDLNLKGCELAILSACQTNYGPEQRGEGVWALSRGFLVAGSRRVVASNWLVDDQSAASLVYAFCERIAEQEKAGSAVDYAQALQDAKRWTRRQPKWQHPYYWATFSLIGPG
jgi:CHAT domain-containing protein/Tfp pilus assembly protein PilF